MRPLRPLSGLLKTLLIGTLLALPACGDEVTDPDALLDSAEAEAVLRSASALPSLPVVIDRAGDPADPADRTALFRAQELWNAGVSADDGRARARRRLAVGYATDPLARALAPSDWDAVERDLQEWSATAESMLRHIALPRVATRLADARVHLGRAAASTDPSSRGRALLLAGAELVETTPRFVARSLAAEADAAVGRALTRAADPDAVHLRRAVRLKDWSARAVESGDYLLAIQRAYYALQLVESR